MVIPEGWKLVPVDPTEAMIRAVKPFINSGKEYHKGRFIYDWHIEPEGWSAMLAATPTPSQVTHSQDQLHLLLDNFVELNTNNYGHDDVESLQAWALDAYELLKGKQP